MNIISITTDVTGQIGVNPRIVKIVTSSNLASVTAPGAISNLSGFPIYPTDSFLISYNFGTSSLETQMFSQSGSGASVTLQPSGSNVILPVVSGHIPTFSGNEGDLDDIGLVPSDPTGDFVVMAMNTPTTLNKVVYTVDTNGSVDSGSSPDYRRLLITSFNSPDVAADIIWVDTTVGFAQLSTGQSAALYTYTNGASYIIRNIFLNKTGTNFSGGGGDRNLAITDGINVYSVIPAATAQALTNSKWGDTAVPAPASISWNTVSNSGNLSLTYSGGTTDYTAGSVTISVALQRIS